MKKSPEFKYAEKYYYRYKIASIVSFSIGAILCIFALIMSIIIENFAKDAGIVLFIVSFVFYGLMGILTHLKSEKIWKDIVIINKRDKEKKNEDPQ